jgi:hypothetical protein
MQCDNNSIASQDVIAFEDIVVVVDDIDDISSQILNIDELKVLSNHHNFVCTIGNENGSNKCNFGSFQQNNMHNFYHAPTE